MWTYWYVEETLYGFDEILNEIVMAVCYFALWTLFMLLFIAYYNDVSMYNVGTIWMFIFFQSYLLGMLLLAIADRISYTNMVYLKQDPTFHFGVYQQTMFLLTVGFNAFVTITAIMDVFQHPVSYVD